MKRRIVAIWISLVMVLSTFVIIDVITDISQTVKGTTRYVNETGSGGAYSNIQDAINASNDGDAVFVFGGTYYEQIIVNRTIYLVGENCENTTIHGGGSGNVVTISSRWVNITGFNITNGNNGIQVLTSADNISIIDNIVHANFNAGINLDSTLDNNILNNTVLYNNDGIYLLSSSNNHITNNNVTSNNREGIFLESSSYNYITNNNVTLNFMDGIMIYLSPNNNINNNNISNNLMGIFTYLSSNITIIDNNISNHTRGISFGSSSDNTIIDNHFTGDGVFISGNQISHYNSHSIPDNNFINGKPLYYYKDGNGVDIDGINLGQLILVNCTDCDVRNLLINNTDIGIEIACSTNILLRDNEVSLNGDYGIYVESSSSCIISNNNITYNKRGINLYESTNNNITGNNISSNNASGINLGSSSNNNIKDNNISSNNITGIRFISSIKNNIINNYVWNNSFSSISLSSSSDGNIISSNNVLNSKHGIHFYSSSNNTIENNIVSSNEWDGIQLYKSSNNNTIIDNHVTYNDYGIHLYSSSFNNMTDNYVYQNINDGISLYKSPNNNITRNNVSSNIVNGIYLYDSSNNLIYHNNIIGNTNQASDNRNDNFWDNGYPSGGNYWSDYGGVDNYNGPNQNILGSDGIGDTNYSIDSDSQDNYPLMKPFQNYNILIQGWNLISIPLIQKDQNLTKVLEVIEGYYDAVQWYDINDLGDPWKHHKVGKPFGNDLFELNITMGFWIHIIQPGETLFLYNGTQPTSNQTIQLHKGWNMVGYPSLSSHNRTNGLNGLDFGSDVDCIQWFDASSQTWHFMDENDSFVPGRGYWMHSKVDTSWEVPL